MNSDGNSKDSSLIQNEIERFVNKDVYIHLETTNGAYASHFNEKMMTVGAFIRNAMIRFERGKITGTNPYRVGLKWITAGYMLKVLRTGSRR